MNIITKISKKYQDDFTFDEVNETFNRIANNIKENFFYSEKNVRRMVEIELLSRLLAKKYEFSNPSDIEKNIYHYYPKFETVQLSYQAFYGRLRWIKKHLDRYCYVQKNYGIRW